MSQRLAELKVEEKSNTTPIIAINNSDEGKIVQQYNSSEAVQKLLSHVQSILQVIDGEKFKQFLEISHSKRYVTRLFIIVRCSFFFFGQIGSSLYGNMLKLAELEQRTHFIG